MPLKKQLCIAQKRTVKNKLIGLPPGLENIVGYSHWHAEILDICS